MNHPIPPVHYTSLIRCDEDGYPIRTVPGKGGYVMGLIEGVKDRVLAELRSDSDLVYRTDSDDDIEDEDFDDDEGEDDDNTAQVRREAAVLLSQSRRADAWKRPLSGGQKLSSQSHSQIRKDSVDRRISAWQRPLSINKQS